jgi:hypothetical protein
MNRNGTIEQTTWDALRQVVEQLQGSANMLQVLTRFMERPAFMNQLCGAISEGVERHLSPFVDRQGAAAYSFSSESFVDEMAKAGIIHRYGGNGMPRYLKSDIEAAIRQGKWQKPNAKTQGARF